MTTRTAAATVRTAPARGGRHASSAAEPPATTQPVPVVPEPAARRTTAADLDRHEPRAHPVLAGLWTGLTSGLLALVLLLAGLVIVVPRLAGGIPLTILSGSMEPNLPVGSLAVVVPVAPEDVRIGDVVTYLPHPDDPTAVTHRVTGIAHRADGGRTFTLQGDANTRPDAPVQDLQVRARVLYAVPWLGYLNSAVNGDERHAAVYVVAGAFFVWALRLWSRAWRGRPERGDDPAADDAADVASDAARGAAVPDATSPTPERPGGSPPAPVPAGGASPR